MPGSRLGKTISTMVIPLGLCAISLTLQIFEPTASDWLRYDRTAIQQGEVWRLITGNLVHLGWEHLLMNLAGLILIGLLYVHTLQTIQWLVVILISSLGVSAGLYLTNPQLDWYVGQSGMLHGLFVAGLIINLRQGMRLEWLLLLGLALKLVWEQTHGALPGSAELAGGAVIVDAHLYGALCGLALGLVLKPKSGKIARL